MHRTFRYPLYPTLEQEEVLLQWLGVFCDLFNAALQERRDSWRLLGKSITKYDQNKSLTQIRFEDEVIAEIPVWPLRSAIDRVDKAYQKMFERKKNGKKGGRPRFKKKKKYKSFDYPVATKYLIDGDGRSARVMVPQLGAIKANIYRPLKGAPKEVTISRDSTGRWWFCVKSDLGEAPTLKDVATIDPSRVVGIDLGIATLIATSHGEIIENPQHAARSAAKLKSRQQMFARRKKGSASRRRAGKLVAKTHAHIANQRQNYAWHVAKKLVAENDVIAHEDLDVAALARAALGKHVKFAGWTLLLQAIRCKAEEAGAVVVAVDPRGTSQLCSRCGNEVRKGLADRWHECPHCGASLDRDVNAAINVKHRGVTALGMSVAEASNAKAKKPNRRSTKKRGNDAADPS